MLKRHLLFFLALISLILSHTAIAQANDSVLRFVPAGERSLERSQKQDKELKINQQQEQKQEQKQKQEQEAIESTNQFLITENPVQPLVTESQSPAESNASSDLSSIDAIIPVSASRSTDRSGRLNFQPTTSIPQASTLTRDPDTSRSTNPNASNSTSSISLSSTESSLGNAGSSSVADGNLNTVSDSKSPSNHPALDAVFQGTTHSLVAKAVGSAEGTRTPKGDRTSAYYGHVDPGNKVWNLGSFSYQHQAASPEDADRRQLDRLRRQADLIQRKAADYQLQLSLEELLNGIDLANQAPKAALDRDSYVDWLVRARRAGKEGFEAILWARTYAFVNPVTRQWDAPGLGNTKDSIRRDQKRRMLAIADAIAVHQKLHPRTLRAMVKPSVSHGSLPQSQERG